MATSELAGLALFNGRIYVGEVSRSNGVFACEYSAASGVTGCALLSPAPALNYFVPSDVAAAA